MSFALGPGLFGSTENWPANRVSNDELACRLALVPVDEIVDYVVHPNNPWHHRFSCARALHARTPFDRADSLLSVVRNDADEEMVRLQVIRLLCSFQGPHSRALLDWLREPSGFENSVRAQTEFLTARAALGDVDAARPLLAAVGDSYIGMDEEKAIIALIVRYGLPGVLDVDSPRTLMLTGGTSAARRLGVRLCEQTGIDITPALADPSVIVARDAYDLAVAHGPHRDFDRLPEVIALAAQPGPGRFWALAVAAARGRIELVRAVWEELGSPRVELPRVPADVRAAILRHYVPAGSRTDPRWLIEAALLAPVAAPDEGDLVNRAVAALAAAGLRPGQPISAAEEWRQGAGTYYGIETSAGRVTVSTLGPFVRVFGDVGEVQAALPEFRHIDEELARTVFTGLAASDFGGPGPQPIGQLLFNWHD
ncbi:hypothetical protein LTV02_01635 [Nocardia yamanashiensis]|uniref:hypothetical protein n=1 Tax=Nocardia yamanashiensis TaxID=209247 RepID=UPI001E39F7FD|nr:hypothetical protein [Nocardia yamanashiensis]UGT42158.1 hypothetical protein LTV02_01635 [Nocardia yamanashiensis]